MKNYLLVYDDSLGNRNYINQILEILDCDWRYDMNNCYYLKSNKSADELVKGILQYTKGRFFITEITNNRQGILPKKTWDFLN